jgi:hypothetical protein
MLNHLRTAIIIAPAVAGTLAVILFYYASLPVPQSKATWERNSRFETRFRNRQRASLALGTIMVVLALLGTLADVVGLLNA